MRHALEFTLLMLLATASVQAQTVYRCGSSFSDVPCEAPQLPPEPAADTPAVQRALPATADFASEPDVIQAAKEACVARLKTDVAFLDPDSVRVGAVERRTPWNTLIEGKPVSARMYVIQVDAKNGLGKYSGEWPFVCNMDLAELEVLNIVPPLPCTSTQQRNCTYTTSPGRSGGASRAQEVE